MTTIVVSLLLFASTLHRDTSIRTTDWKQFFLSDTATYEIDTAVEYSWGNFTVSFKGSEEGDWGGGFPDMDYITFGDLDGDGVEEAEISFYTGGSAGSCSYAILRKTSEGIRTVHIGYGYQVGSVIKNDTLNIYQPIPTDYDPNCCAQSMIEQRYRLKGDSVVEVDSLAYGRVGATHSAVHQFYKLLGNKEYEAAYSLLSARYQIKHPYREWVRGYASTYSITIPEDGILSPSERDTTVTVKLNSVDVVNGKNVTATYAGTWKLIWYGLDRGWLLDEPKIRKIR